MQVSSRSLVWIAYLSVVLSFVWGIPGLLAALYVIKNTAPTYIVPDNPKQKRDLRGARAIAYVGLAFSTFFSIMIIWKLVSTYLQ